MPDRRAFEIGGQSVAPGTRRTIGLPVSYLSDHTPVTMSAHIVHGRQDGPVIFVSGGVHGDEVIGLEIVRRLLRSPRLRGLRGTLLVVPIVNSFGFIAKSRYLPDRRDLNRSFPGSDEGSLAARMAHLFLTEIVGRAEMGIDIHSAAIHRTNYPQIRITPDDREMRRLADIFGAPIVMTSPLREGSLRQAAKAMGRNILLYEAGEGLRFDETSVRTGLAGILRVLASRGMISTRGVAPPKSPPHYCPSSKWLRAPMGGLFRSFRADGELARRDDVLGAVSDPFGEQEREIVAPFDGLIVGRAVMPVVNEGDAVFHLARVQSVPRVEGMLEVHSTQLADDPLFDEDEII